MISQKTLIKKACVPGQEIDLVNEVLEFRNYLTDKEREAIKNFEFKELEKHTYERHSIKKPQTTNF
jgi:hypothetical protein